MLLDPAGFSGADVLNRRAGSLDLRQRARLAELADRVRVAHDLLLAFADRYAAFPRLAEAQEREVRLLRRATPTGATPAAAAGARKAPVHRPRTASKRART